MKRRNRKQREGTPEQAPALSGRPTDHACNKAIARTLTEHRYRFPPRPGESYRCPIAAIAKKHERSMTHVRTIRRECDAYMGPDTPMNRALLTKRTAGYWRAL